MSLRSGCSLNNLRFGDKVQNQTVGRCQGFTKARRNEKHGEKSQENFTGAGRLSNLLESITLLHLQVEAGFSS